MTSESFHFQNRNYPNLENDFSHGGAELHGRHALFGPQLHPTHSVLSLLELKTRVPTHHLPRDSSSFISQQRESDCFPFLPSYSPRGDFSRSASGNGAEAMSHLATFHGGGAASDLQPQGQAGRGGSRMARGHRWGGGRKVQILAPSHISPATWARCSFLPPTPISSPGNHHWPHLTRQLRRLGHLLTVKCCQGFHPPQPQSAIHLNCTKWCPSL